MVIDMGKIAVVTGASSGIGREFVLALSKKFKKLDSIWIVARRKEKLVELQKQTKIPLKIIEFDLISPSAKENFYSILQKEQPDIKFLINCAGYGKVGHFDSIKEEEQLGMIELNCYALTWICKLCLNYMTKGARIINMASIAAFFPFPTFSVYAATKAYVLNFSRALGAELKQKQIYVTAVCPGPVKTEFFGIAEETGYHVWYKDMLMAEAKDVVETAICDSIKQHSVSVYGCKNKMIHCLSKILPHAVFTEIIRHW